MQISILLTLSVTLSTIQARVARPHLPEHLVCREDAALRALERYAEYSSEFCPEFLAFSNKPKWLNSWNNKRVSSACLCFDKTATTLGPTASAALPSAPSGLSAVLITQTGNPSGLPTDTAPNVSASSPSENAITATPNVQPTTTGSAVPLSEAPTIASNTVTPSSSVGVSDKGAIPSNTYPKQPFGPGPGKRGLIYDSKTEEGWSSLFNGSKYVTYGSNGGLDRDLNGVSVLDDSFSFVPTLTVDKNLDNSDWTTNVPVLIEGGSKGLLAPGEAELSVTDAVTVYKKLMQPYWGETQLGTPAITNTNDSATGLNYLESFVKTCADQCSFNFINVHFYLERESADVTMFTQALKDYITKDIPALQAKYPQLKDLPIYIGEWWLTDASQAEGADLMDSLLDWLDSEPSVLAYSAADGLWKGSLIDDLTSGLTSAGKKYAGI